MAKIGLKYIKAAVLDEKDNSYSGIIALGKAIKADVTVTSNDVKLYAEDALAESDQSFKEGSISLNVDDLEAQVYGTLLGHTVDSATKQITAKSTDIAPYVGVGFYATTKKSNVAGYRAIVLTKVQFSEPNDNSETKGETVSFQTPTIEGKINSLSDGVWKYEQTFATELEAQTYINEKLGETI